MPIDQSHESAENVEKDTVLNGSGLFRALIEHSFEGIAVLDASRRLTYASPSFERILGLPPAELLGQLLLDQVFAEDRIKLELIFTHLEQAPGNVIRLQWRQRHANGSWRWLEGVGVNLLHVAEVQGLVLHFHDVTDRRLQDEALRLSEARLRQIIDLIPAYIYAKDFHGRYILANDMTARAFRQSPAELEGQTQAELSRAQLTQQDLQTDRDVILSGEMKMIAEESLTFSEDLTQILRTYKIPYVSPDTGHPAALSVSMDITELKQAEDALRKSEASLRAILETTDTAYLLINLEARILTFNRLSREWSKREFGQIPVVGMPMVELISPERRPEIDALIARVLQGETIIYQRCYEHGEEPPRWYHVRLYPVANEQGVIGACFAVSDISERKRTEQRLLENQAHLEASQQIAHVGSWELDLTRLDDINVNPLRWSAQCFRVFGFEPDSVEVSNELFFSRVHPEDRPLIAAAVGKALETGGVYSIEHRIVLPGGEERVIHERAEIIHDIHTGQRLKMIGTAQDITERKQAENERTRLMLDLFQRNQTLEEFSYVVSHNLRAPVANLLGLVELIRQGDASEEVIDGIGRSSRWLEEIVLDLNRILQVRRGLEEKREVVSLSELCQELQLSLGAQLRHCHASLQTDFQTIDEIRTLRSSLYSVFANLVSNSLRFRHPERAPEIRIRSRREPQRILIDFSDNGLGLDLERHGKHLFGLYQRFHTQIEGKGVGLFMVKAQLERLGGRISVLSEPGQGSTFTLAFDVA